MEPTLDKVLGIRVSREEHVLLRRRAKQAQREEGARVTASSLVRRLIVRELRGDAARESA